MKKEPKKSRIEISRDVRRILARHLLDFSSNSYSCMGREILITGDGRKIDSEYLSDFHMNIIQAEIHRLFPAVILKWELSEDRASNQEDAIIFEEIEE